MFIWILGYKPGILGIPMYGRPHMSTKWDERMDLTSHHLVKILISSCYVVFQLSLLDHHTASHSSWFHEPTCSHRVTETWDWNSPTVLNHVCENQLSNQHMVNKLAELPTGLVALKPETPHGQWWLISDFEMDSRLSHFWQEIQPIHLPVAQWIRVDLCGFV